MYKIKFDFFPLVLCFVSQETKHTNTRLFAMIDDDDLLAGDWGVSGGGGGGFSNHAHRITTFSTTRDSPMERGGGGVGGRGVCTAFDTTCVSIH